MKTRIRPLRIFVAGALLVAAGCSLVNSYDDVAPRTDGTYAAADATVVDVIGPADVVTTDSPVIDGGGDAAVGSGGAIVVGGRVFEDGGSIKYVLTVLDPIDGRELGTRETMVVSGIAYDGLRDLWYIFESKSTDFVPGVNDEVILHVRELDTKTGKWTERSQKSVPVIQSFDSIGVTRERLTYVAYKAPEAGAGIEFVTLSTADPSNLVDVSHISTTIAPLGAMSSRSATGTGGFVNYLRLNAPDCDAGANNVCMEVVSVQVTANNVVVESVNQLGITSRFNVPSFGVLPPPTNLDLVVFPRAVNDAAAPSTIHRYDPVLHTEQQTPTDFIITDTALKRAAASACDNIAFVVATNGDLRVHAIPLQQNGGGTPANAVTGHSGQTVYFEPMTKTVITPFAQGDSLDWSSFKLGGTQTAPTLTARTDFKPPADLRPILLGIREPLPVVCN